jgi:6-phosphogluconolactonase
VKPDTRQKRITATGKIINNSSKIYYIVTGKGKASIVSEIIEGRGVRTLSGFKGNACFGHLVWMLDVPAASLLRV